jgi:hypothetical protein
LYKADHPECNDLVGIRRLACRNCHNGISRTVENAEANFKEMLSYYKTKGKIGVKQYQIIYFKRLKFYKIC